MTLALEVFVGVSSVSEDSEPEPSSEDSSFFGAGLALTLALDVDG